MSKVQNKNDANGEKKNSKKDAKSETAIDSKMVPDEENIESDLEADQTLKQPSEETEQAQDIQYDEEEGVIEEQAVLEKDEIDELRKKAEAHDSLLDQLLRTRAEFLNYQKRMRKEIETSAQFAVQELILDLFPELDNFERALNHAKDANDLENFVKGIKLIENQIFKVLGKYGVKPIETVGKNFDPNLHEAVTEEENNDLPHHTVTEEFQRGFFLKDRVIRPAKVKVSRRTVNEDMPDKESDVTDEDSSSS